MIALAHLLAITCYLGATGVAAAPFARPMPAPVRGVVLALAAGVIIHLAALVSFAQFYGQGPFSGIGPALSVAGILVAISLLLVESIAGEVSLTLAAAPFAAVATCVALLAGLVPGHVLAGVPGAWLTAHVALSFVGIASFATAAAAGVMYLIERRELKSRNFGAIFRFFPPLETLDRVNHLSAVAGWLALTVGVVLAIGYSIAYRTLDVGQTIWGLAAWAAVSALTAGRVIGGWQARRAALVSCVAFAVVLALYVALRLVAPRGGQFL